MSWSYVCLSFHKSRYYSVSREFSVPFSFPFAILHMCKTVNLHTHHISALRSGYLEKFSVLHFSPDTYLLKKLYTTKIILLLLLPIPVEQPLPLVHSSLSATCYIQRLCLETVSKIIDTHTYIYIYILLHI
jgi:hypothetical protein